MGERGPSNTLCPANFARLALGLILTAKYVHLFVSSPPYNAGCYVIGALLSPLTAIPHFVRLSSLLRRYFLNCMRSTRAYCVDNVLSRVGGGTDGIR